VSKLVHKFSFFFLCHAKLPPQLTCRDTLLHSYSHWARHVAVSGASTHVSTTLSANRMLRLQWDPGFSVTDALPSDPPRRTTASAGQPCPTSQNIYPSNGYPLESTTRTGARRHLRLDSPQSSSPSPDLRSKPNELHAKPPPPHAKRA
jgi:hypothetical protein